MDYKVVIIRITKNKYFLVKSNSRMNNTIINSNDLLNILLPYSENKIIYLMNILLIKDVNNKILKYDEIFEILNALIIMNKLCDKRELFLWKS